MQNPTKLFEANEFMADELENSFPFDPHRQVRGPAALSLLEEVLVLLETKLNRKRKRKAKDATRWRLSVNALLANLIAAAINKVDDDRFVAIGFNNNDYVGSDLSVTALTNARDALVQSGLVEGQSGFWQLNYVGEKGFTRRTRLRAAPALHDLFSKHEVNHRSISIPVDHLIRLKERNSNCGEMPNQIEASRPILICSNQLLLETNIVLPDDVWLQIDELQNDNLDTEQKKFIGDTAAVSLYRSFRGDWTRGGRLYGGWWMNLPKKQRQYLTIDNEATIELDYATLHPTLLYLRLGRRLDFDPYVVNGFTQSDMRDLGKRTLNRLLNKKPRRGKQNATLKADAKDLDILPQGLSFNEYLSSLKSRNAEIAGWFGNDEGVQLQREDSELALGIIEKLNAMSIVVLPIHDSFIVKARHKEELHQAMATTFHNKYGEGPIIH